MNQPPPTGLPLVDGLASLSHPTLDDYVAAASEYIGGSPALNSSAKKASQIRLSNALAAILLSDLRKIVNLSPAAVAGEHEVSGALRNVQADVSESHPLDGLRLAVEVKPINLAVGRAIWNRFGDIRQFAVNLHLKFPFAVVGGLLAIPTYEEELRGGQVRRKSTTHLIVRAVNRLVRAGGRITEGDAAHLMEGVGVLVYDPALKKVDPQIPPPGSGLRWDEFVQALASAYQARFED